MTTRLRGVVLTALACAAAPGCADEWAERQEASEVDPYFTKAEWETIETLTPGNTVADFKPALDPSNRYGEVPGAIDLGHKLFFDCRLGDGRLDPIGEQPPNDELGSPTHQGRSCATCHQPELGFSDEGLLGEDKDITTVLNIASYDYHVSNGKFDSLWSMPMAPTENGFLNTERNAVATLLALHYRAEYTAVFGLEHDEQVFFDWVDTGSQGPAPESVNRIYANYGKAIAAYMRQINSGPSAFDQYVADATSGLNVQLGENGEQSALAKAGLKLFITDAACIACHSGDRFSDNEFHDIGLPSEGGQGRWDALDTWRDGDATPVEFRRSSQYSDDTSFELPFRLRPRQTRAHSELPDSAT